MTGFLSLFLACLPVLSVSHPHFHLRFIFEAQYSEIFLLRYHALYLGILDTMSYMCAYFEGGGDLPEIPSSSFEALNTVKKETDWCGVASFEIITSYN